MQDSTEYKLERKPEIEIKPHKSIVSSGGGGGHIHCTSMTRPLDMHVAYRQWFLDRTPLLDNN